MTGTLFRWTMRNGSRILLLFAVFILAAGVVSALRYVGRFHGENELDPQWLLVFGALLAAVPSAAFCFFGALLIDRLDRWIAREPGDREAD
jgi:predicted membrane protein